MGAILSTVNTLFQTLKSLIRDYEVVSKRISESPGIPRPNSSIPYWTIPQSSISQHGKDAEIPPDADIVIIGSGITGASVAKCLLEHFDVNPDATAPTIVMLDARDACSGATGRNGGHASPLIYNEYFALKKAHGSKVAIEILRFRLAHITSLIALAKEEGLLEDSQARMVVNYDAFLHPDFFGKAKEELEAFIKEVPKDIADQFGVTEEEDSIEKFQLSKSIIGLISKPGASIHPYRLVTGILSRLLKNFSNFQLYTHTPCTSITTERDTYIISTPKGVIKARHIVHATNAWSSHLLPGLRRKIVPFKAHMSAQRPSSGLNVTQNRKNAKPGDWTGSRAFVFYPGTSHSAYDYLTQFLPSPSSSTPPPDDNDGSVFRKSLPTSGEFMFGGGAMLGGSSEAAVLGVVGVADDDKTDFAVEAYLSGALPMYFGKNWTEEGKPSDDENADTSGPQWGKGRVKAIWTGLVAFSADNNPWVGRVPVTVSQRKEPSPLLPASNSLETKSSNTNGDKPTLSPAGEWVCAGYSGEGMVHAWLSGRALARMILGVKENDLDPALPDPFIITEKRIQNAKIEDFMQLDQT